MEEVYEFFPDSVRSQIPKLYSQEGSKDPKVHVKFFTPWAGWTWYATEGEEDGDDFRFFGYVVGHEREWGYFVLSELQSVTGPAGLKIERDIHFTPRPASEISDIHSHYKPKPSTNRGDGVSKSYCGTCDTDTPHEGAYCLACGQQ